MEHQEGWGFSPCPTSEISSFCLFCKVLGCLKQGYQCANNRSSISRVSRPDSRTELCWPTSDEGQWVTAKTNLITAAKSHFCGTSLSAIYVPLDHQTHNSADLFIVRSEDILSVFQHLNKPDDIKPKSISMANTVRART